MEKQIIIVDDKLDDDIRQELQDVIEKQLRAVNSDVTIAIYPEVWLTGKRYNAILEEKSDAFFLIFPDFQTVLFLHKNNNALRSWKRTVKPQKLDIVLTSTSELSDDIAAGFQDKNLLSCTVRVFSSGLSAEKYFRLDWAAAVAAWGDNENFPLDKLVPPGDLLQMFVPLDLLLQGYILALESGKPVDPCEWFKTCCEGFERQTRTEAEKKYFLQADGTLRCFAEALDELLKKPEIKNLCGGDQSVQELQRIFGSDNLLASKNLGKRPAERKALYELCRGIAECVKEGKKFSLDVADARRAHQAILRGWELTGLRLANDTEYEKARTRLNHDDIKWFHHYLGLCQRDERKLGILLQRVWPKLRGKINAYVEALDGVWGMSCDSFSQTAGEIRQVLEELDQSAFPQNSGENFDIGGFIKKLGVLWRGSAGLLSGEGFRKHQFLRRQIPSAKAAMPAKNFEKVLEILAGLQKYLTEFVKNKQEKVEDILEAEILWQARFDIDQHLWGLARRTDGDNEGITKIQALTNKFVYETLRIFVDHLFSSELEDDADEIIEKFAHRRELGGKGIDGVLATIEELINEFNKIIPSEGKRSAA